MTPYGESCVHVSFVNHTFSFEHSHPNKKKKDLAHETMCLY